jgi:putative methyltransferase (TIGR01177 family)
MTRFWVEASGENPSLAAAELAGVMRGPTDRGAGTPDPAPTGFSTVDLPGRPEAHALGRRLAMARRILEPWGDQPAPAVLARFESEGRGGAPAAFRPLGSARRPLGSPRLAACAAAYVRGGGRIDLERPLRRFFLAETPGGGLLVAEEVAAVDRAPFAERRMARLPFQRPVSLSPRLARVAANLAGIRPGDRVVDPFVGTGALALEAALLGARVTGVDRDPEMVRGAIRNFAHFGQSFEALWVEDAGAAADDAAAGRFDALVTDPPYGRASGSGGEPAAALVARVIPRWADRVRPDGRLVVLAPGGPDPVGSPWERVVCVRDRVHRSLTREFRAYARRGVSRS